MVEYLQGPWKALALGLYYDTEAVSKETTPQLGWWDPGILSEIFKLRGINHPAVMLRVLLLTPTSDSERLSVSLES
jgi:hypothetical protein